MGCHCLLRSGKLTLINSGASVIFQLPLLLSHHVFESKVQVPGQAFDQYLVAFSGTSQTFIKGFGARNMVVRASSGLIPNALGTSWLHTSFSVSHSLN